MILGLARRLNLCQSLMLMKMRLMTDGKMSRFSLWTENAMKIMLTGVNDT
ncbi:hypothetical protein [Bacteroides stercoris]|nr:hypothetical protein [Bacteroides stercoris]